ncbi:hypothetical protein [Flavilitoribacter nigricans]|uniref:Uncharacterized protein n=1 Tax=Flavilitoribacter nigricans (strain ATCC 23147 / DSM 23189 / NBRC 102662 / NCIMB 1420 / SS-2) TaxID=1122177 RepID=A0A2D0NBH2_FLAN2|nr:hypothetical protein [Flavilitoribacter nigricans]PHN05113.1 hypothetical protein CRP01_19010 [Flavilitoribacter nigricans DSM 23189 = NBRC 102662]
MNKKTVDKKGIYRLLGAYLLGILAIGWVFYNNYSVQKTRADKLQIERDSFETMLISQQELMMELRALGEARKVIDSLRVEELKLIREDKIDISEDLVDIENTISDSINEFNKRKIEIEKMAKNDFNSSGIYLLKESIVRYSDMVHKERKNRASLQGTEGELSKRLQEALTELEDLKQKYETCDTNLKLCLKGELKCDCSLVACTNIEGFKTWYEGLTGDHQIREIIFRVKGDNKAGRKVKDDFLEQYEALINYN